MRLPLVHRLRAILASSRGYTLPEVTVAIGIITVISAMFASGVFQSLSIQRFWRDDVIATKELRRAGGSVARDAFNAVTTSLTDGGAAEDNVTFTWVDASDTAHSAVYMVSGTELRRTFDGNPLTVGAGVTSASFSLSGKVLTFVLTVEGARGADETKTLKTYLRSLQ
ncbi:MAG: prepilin-type N-terminal cleavage/methylation domain-containing protein [Chloroflexi bacterium]|nr:prepilin-type N-terminal cleavage/methylation domain-containing protein [Chloroflexota bacterium]